jgi:predicted O-linked N-acetylglucosamine transferase (SPINDLY family)
VSEPQDRNRTIQHVLTLYRQGRWVECEQAAQLAIRDDAGDGFAWKALGAALAAQGKAGPALEAKERAVQLLPRDVEAIGNLFNAYQAAGRLRDAAKCREKICELKPDSPEALNDWGNALRDAQLMPEARNVYERALRIDPARAEVLSNLANTLADLGEQAEAERRYREAIALQPSVGQIHGNLGNLLKLQGRHAEALTAYREAARLAPDFAGGHSNYLLALNHVPGITPQRIKEDAQGFGRWATARAARVDRLPRAAGAPLRVGFVSGDLRDHPVGHFLENMLTHWPRDRVQLYAYHAWRLETELSARIFPCFARWRPIAHLDDTKAAQLIARDGIDVLVDLSGHTAYNRLPLFAWKPAPVQATWLGYFATTGVEQIDWLIADSISVPPGEEARFTERIWRLPGTRMCFTPPREAPEVALLPALANGFVTFGSFQHLGKINDGVLALWSRVMAQVPGSRLRVQNAQLGEAESQRSFRERLAAHGIDPSRASFHGKSSRAAYLRAHAEVDLVLDTFPYPGGTTTCEGLWMGVPTLTLKGDSMLSRQGQSLLAAANLPQWIAGDAGHFVTRAVALASDVRALGDLRASLRRHVAASPLFDAKRFAGELAAAFETMARSA